MSKRSTSDTRLQRFGARLRREREDRHLSIEQLAAAADVSMRQVLRVEAGDASPSLVWLLAIAAALDMRVSDLLGDF